MRNHLNAVPALPAAHLLRIGVLLSVLACALLGWTRTSPATPMGNPMAYIRNPDPAQVPGIRTLMKTDLAARAGQVKKMAQESPQPTTERILALVYFAQTQGDWLTGEMAVAARQEKHDDQFLAEVWKPANANWAFFLEEYQKIAASVPVPTEPLPKEFQQKSTPELDRWVARLSLETNRYVGARQLLRLALLADRLGHTGDQRLKEAFQSLGGKVAPLKILTQPAQPGIASLEELQANAKLLRELAFPQPPLNPPKVPPLAPVADADQAALTALVKQYYADMKSGGANAVRKHFVDPATVDKFKNPNNLTLAEMSFKRMDIAFVRLSPTDISVHADAIDLVVNEPGKDPAKLTVSFAATLVKTEQGWKIKKMEGMP